MFKPCYDICEHCGSETGKKLIVISRPRLCAYHNRLRKGKEVLKKFRPNRRKSTGEAVMFREIWEERPHFCTNCNVYLGDEPMAFHFAHIKRKSTNPALRLDKNNIKLLCLDCHREMDQGTKESFNKRKK